MHVFVTGGTGTIGSAVVAELLAHGHTVLALTRSDGSAQTAEGAGAEVLRGGLADLDVLRAGVASPRWPRGIRSGPTGRSGSGST